MGLPRREKAFVNACILHKMESDRKREAEMKRAQQRARARRKR